MENVDILKMQQRKRKATSHLASALINESRIESFEQRRTLPSA
jgi:hypothetical protein